MKQTMKTFMTLMLAMVLTVVMLLPSVGTVYAAEETYTEEFLGENPVPAATHMEAINPNASQESKNLLAYLQTMTDTNRMIVGTFDISDSNQVYNDVKEQFDVECALYSARYSVATEDNFHYEGKTYQSLDFYNIDKVNALLAEHYHNGNILLIHADTVLEEEAFEYIFKTGMAADRAEADLMGFGKHFDATYPDRDLHLYEMLCKYNEQMFDALHRLEAMGVKAYMYRPWAEFTRFTFHGIDQEQRAYSRRVWQQTSDLFKESGLEGFLLTWAPNTRWYEYYFWYPGNEYCDVIAPTMYGQPSTIPGQGGWLNTARHANHDWFVKTGKPIGFSEISCRQAEWTVAGFDGRQSWYQTLRSVIINYPETAWVNCWGDGMYSLSNHTNGQPSNGNDDGYMFLHSPFSLTLEDIPDYRVTQFDTPGVVQLYTEKNYGGNGKNTLVNNWIGLEEKTYTYNDLKALGLDPAKIASFHVNSGLGVTFYASDDATGAGWSYLFGTGDLSKDDCYGKIRSLKVIRPSLLSQDKYGIYGNDNDGDAWKANDGFGSCWTGMVDEKGRGWLVMDLEEPCSISNWEVQHAGYAEQAEMYNTVDFCLQVSLDGKTWTTVDSVVGNTGNRTSRNLNKLVVGQYFRLLITNPSRVTDGLDVGRMTIAEWKLYGLTTGQGPQNGDWDALLNDNYTTPIPPTTKPTTTTTKPTTTTTKKPTTTTTAVKLSTPTVSTSNATSGIKVTWNKVSKADSYCVYRRLYSSGKWGSWSKIKTTTSVSYTDEGAKAGKNYQYMVKAVKGSVTSGYKATATITRLGVASVKASNATKGIKVSWGKVTGAKTYRVYRRLYSSGKWGSWSHIKSTSSTSYTDTTAKAGKNYQYMVRAVKGDSTGYYKVTATVTRMSVPKVTAANATKGIKVSWGKVTGAKSYRVYRRLYSSGKWGSWSRIKSTSSTSYTDTKAKTGKNYQYMVRAVKGDSTSYYKATATIRRLKAPGSVKLKKATKGFKVTWSKATGATKYEVYRRLGTGKWSKIKTTTKTGYTDKTAKKGKYYTYRVRAVYNTSKSVFKTGTKTKR